MSQSVCPLTQIVPLGGSTAPAAVSTARPQTQGSARREVASWSEQEGSSMRMSISVGSVYLHPAGVFRAHAGDPRVPEPPLRCVSVTQAGRKLPGFPSWLLLDPRALGVCVSPTVLTLSNPPPLRDSLTFHIFCCPHFSVPSFSISACNCWYDGGGSRRMEPCFIHLPPSSE